MNLFESIPETWLDTSSDNILETLLHAEGDDNTLYSYNHNSTRTSLSNVTFQFTYVYDNSVHTVDSRLTLTVIIRLRKLKKHLHSVIRTTVDEEMALDNGCFWSSEIGKRNFSFPTREYQPKQILTLADVIAKYFYKTKPTKYFKVTKTDFIDPKFLNV